MTGYVQCSAHNQAGCGPLSFPLGLQDTARVCFRFLPQLCHSHLLQNHFRTHSHGQGSRQASPSRSTCHYEVQCDNRWPLLVCLFPSPVYSLPCYSAQVNAIYTQGHSWRFLCPNQCPYIICSDGISNSLSTLNFPLWLSNA